MMREFSVLVARICACKYASCCNDAEQEDWVVDLIWYIILATRCQAMVDLEFSYVVP